MSAIETPSQDMLTELVGSHLLGVWKALDAVINKNYDMEQTWGSGGKKWVYEYKYRRGGKTLCCLYAKNNCVGFMIIFGKNEREKFEKIRAELSESVCNQYDAAETYRDGKWVMFTPKDTSDFNDYLKLLAIKRKPNRT